MTTWIFLRHGESVYSEHGRYTGTTDIALTDRGAIEAAGSGAWLRNHYYPDQIYCSPKIRTRQTLTAAWDGTLPESVTFDDRLREIFYGEWEGLTRPQIRSTPGNNYDPWELQPTTIRAGTTGETAIEVRDRVLSLLADCADDKTYWFVTHRTVMRIMSAVLLHLPLDNYRKQFEQFHASINAFQIKPELSDIVGGKIEAQAIGLNLTPWKQA